MTGAGMHRGSVAAGDQLPSSSRAPQASAAAPAAAAGRSRSRAGQERRLPASPVHRLPGSQASRESQQSPGELNAVHSDSGEEANEDVPSDSEQLSGAANGKSLKERMANDRANHNAAKSRSGFMDKLLEKAASAPKHNVSLAVVVFSDCPPSKGRLAVTGLGGAAASNVMPLFDEIRWVVPDTIKSSIRQLKQQFSEAQQQKQLKRRKNGTSRTPLGHGESQAAEQPPAAASEASDAELLCGLQAAGTASRTEVAASDAARSLQQGQLHHHVVAAHTHCRHSCTIVLPCCQSCRVRKMLKSSAYMLHVAHSSRCHCRSKRPKK